MVRTRYMDQYAGDAGGNFWDDEFLSEELTNSSKRDQENKFAAVFPQVSSEVIPNQTNGSTAQASQSSNTSRASVLRRCLSSLSETERVARKRESDREYRKRVKINKEQMQLSLENLTEENNALKKENQSVKVDNASMKQALTNQEKSIDQLRSVIVPLEHKLDKQNVLSDTLSQLLNDPSRFENEKLRNENAWLRKKANLNSNEPQLLEEIATLKAENKVLRVQNDALCAKMIGDNDTYREQKP